MIIVLFPYRFSDYFLHKFRFIEIEKKLKTHIEYVDLSEIVNPNRGKYFTQKKNKKVIQFTSLKQWKKYMREKKKQKNLYIFNLINFDNSKSLYIHYFLKKLNFTIVQYKSSEVFFKKNKYNLFDYFNRTISLLIRNPSRLIYAIKMKFYSKLIRLIKFNKLIILYVGSRKYILDHLNSEKIKFVKYNSSDYFHYLNYKIENSKKRKIKKIVYLDSNAPLFTDKMMFGFNYKYDVVLWYKTLNIFLKQVEKIYKKKVVIIPHPRARNNYNQLYDKNFEILRDAEATVRSISNSYFVLANSATTAASYCVLYNKPINFIYNNQQKLLRPESVLESKLLSNILKTKLINLEDKVDKKKFQLKVNRESYKKYKFNFLTSRETLKKRMFEIWKEILA